MTSAENSISEPPNLKFSGGGYSQIPLHGLCTRDNVPPAHPLPPLPHPGHKKPSYGPAAWNPGSQIKYKKIVSWVA